MSAYKRQDDIHRRECSNCGNIEGLLRCSRCRQAWFCSLKCQKGGPRVRSDVILDLLETSGESRLRVEVDRTFYLQSYWPIHKPECKRNEFADSIEEKEPAFAAWMRSHGKQAVLKDDEVERLERAGKACSGSSRNDVMESMYGRFQPKPKEPAYSAEEIIKMRNVEEASKLEAKISSDGDIAWKGLKIDTGLGLDCGNYKWHQNQSFVEIFVRLPENVRLKDVQVVLTPSQISVSVQMKTIFKGALFAKIKQEDSTWYIEQNVLFITMLKLDRRGNYEDGSNNARTFWKSICKKQSSAETLQIDYPPNSYYNSHWEDPAASHAPRQHAKKPHKLLTSQG